ncbi:MAG: porphobilinogen synthase [Deltaproteobacteria bacterium]|nr:porphobilinogen synthase [Deltaproteobacteria bacterium]MBW1872013.1 porphobilinogen synthase [Deltaproteobacteria bacterium]
MFPTQRPRRLRRTAAIRNLVRETHLHVEDLIYPLFVQENLAKPEPIQAMPGQYRHSLDSLVAEAEKASAAGLQAILLFGIPEKKDPQGSGAFAPDGIVQQAVRAVKQRKLPLAVITDVCMCEYTSHGHCGAIRDNDVDNDPSLAMLTDTAVSQAEAGADIVAPSDMMDGRIAAIRKGLDQAGFEQVAILSYAAKYASAFYGPFRDAAGSAPQFGDRQSYQMDPANIREALKEVWTDLEEGADMVMVKPALAYLDVIRAVKESTDVPVAAYNVSGEYAMIEFGAKAGILDRERIIREILVSIKRAGADLILSYHALEVAGWLK